MKHRKKLSVNKVVVVTGGNGTIGKAIIKKFKSNGAKCFAIDIKGTYPVIKCDLPNEKELKKTLTSLIKLLKKGKLKNES